MSFFNPDVDDTLCDQCWYKDSSYMSAYGTYTPCLKCKDGDMRESDEKMIRDTKKA